MKKFELTLTMNTDDGKSIVCFDRVEADNLVSLLSQFQLVIASVHRQLLDDVRVKVHREFSKTDDDIPF